MTARSLFNIILKIFGLFFIKEIIYTVPQLITGALYVIKSDAGSDITYLIVTAIILAFYTFLAFQLLFQTNIYVDKLKLADGFETEDFTFNISAASVLTIALVIISGLILIDQIPNFCQQVFQYFQVKSLLDELSKPDVSPMIISGAKIIIAFLIIGERKKIANFMEGKKSRPETYERFDLFLNTLHYLDETHLDNPDQEVDQIMSELSIDVHSFLHRNSVKSLIASGMIPESVALPTEELRNSLLHLLEVKRTVAQVRNDSDWIAARTMAKEIAAKVALYQQSKNLSTAQHK